jgi:hypothetical protein
MPSYVYEIDETEDDEIVIGRDDIELEDDVEELFAIQRGLQDRDDHLTMQVEGFRIAGREDPEGLMWFRRVCRAKAATGVGLSRVRQRLVRLGAIENPADRQIRALEGKILAYKAEVLELKTRLGEA